MTEPKQAGKSTFCPFPWASVCVQPYGVTLCCNSTRDLRENPAQSPVEVFEGNAFRRIRKQMLAGEWPQECRNCERVESQGFKSMRQEHLEYDLWGDVLDAYDSQTLTSDPLKITLLELAFDNNCNLKCRMCSPRYSSRWKEDLDFFRSAQERPEDYMPTDVVPVQNLALDNLLDRIGSPLHLRFKGGEPMLIRRLVPTLRKILDRGMGNKTMLNMTTNGTVVPKGFLDLIREFKDVSISVSIDGLDPLQRYIRSGRFSIKDIRTSMEKLLDAGAYLSIVTAFQTYNMLSYDRLVREFMSAIRVFLISPVAGHLSVLIAPKKIRDIARERIERLLAQEGHHFSIHTKSSLEQAILLLKSGQFVEAEWQRFLKFTEILDRARSESLKFAEPELHALVSTAGISNPRLAQSVATLLQGLLRSMGRRMPK